MTRERARDLFLLCRIGSRIGALAVGDVRETMRSNVFEMQKLTWRGR